MQDKSSRLYSFGALLLFVFCHFIFACFCSKLFFSYSCCDAMAMFWYCKGIIMVDLAAHTVSDIIYQLLFSVCWHIEHSSCSSSSLTSRPMMWAIEASDSPLIPVGYQSDSLWHSAAVPIRDVIGPFFLWVIDESSLLELFPVSLSSLIIDLILQMCSNNFNFTISTQLWYVVLYLSSVIPLLLTLSFHQTFCDFL